MSDKEELSPITGTRDRFRTAAVWFFLLAIATLWSFHEGRMRQAIGMAFFAGTQFVFMVYRLGVWWSEFDRVRQAEEAINRMRTRFFGERQP